MVHFNHRRVALVKVTERLYRLWAGTSLWIRLFVQSTDVDGKIVVSFPNIYGAMEKLN